MADGTVLDLGSGGDTIATDDIGGTKYQWVKLVDGTADSATKIASGNGTNTNALRVTVASDSTGVIAVTDNGGNLSIDDGGNSITVDNGGTFVVQDNQVTTDNGGFTDGTTKLFTSGFIYDEVAGTALTENDAAAARVNVNRAQVGIIEDGATRARYATVTASNALKTDGSAVTQPVSDGGGSLTVDNNGTFAVQATVAPTTTGGLTIGPASNAKLISAGTTNATSVKGSAGQVYGWYMSNMSATTTAFVKLYNKATAPTVGSDTPVMVLAIPAGAAANTEFSQGIPFGTGIALAITAAVADADTTAVVANEVVVNLFYK